MDLASYETAQRAVEAFRRDHPGGKVGMTSGGFDLLHPGHKAMLDACKRQCDFLLVCISSDELVRKSKSRSGSSIKPVMSEEERMAMVSGMSGVDHVLIRTAADKSLEQLVRLIQPDVRFFGPDQNVNTVSGNVVTIDEPRIASTSGYIKKIIDAHHEDAEYRNGTHWMNDLDWYR